MLPLHARVTRRYTGSSVTVLFAGCVKEMVNGFPASRAANGVVSLKLWAVRCETCGRSVSVCNWRWRAWRSP